jgi:YbgC/YbaW family acyl-CoA thioester hydrolase
MQRKHLKQLARFESEQEKPIHRYPLQIREGHLDFYGHVNNATYLALFEEARWDWVHHNGYGADRIRETGLGPVILEVHLTFERELGLRQKVVIETQLVTYEGKILTLAHRIIDSSEKIYARATLKVGLFDLKTRKLVPPTPEWTQAIGWKG